MSDKTNISYCDHTWSPWKVCTPVSAGCQNCYASAMSKRFGGPEYRKGVPRVRTKDWQKPLRWNHQLTCDCGAIRVHEEVTAFHNCPKCKSDYRYPRIFPSLCDWLDNEVPIDWLADFLKLIHDTPKLTWLLLTKRPENWLHRCLESLGHELNTGGHRGLLFQNWLSGWTGGHAPSNVWFGVTVENPDEDWRADELLTIPAKVHWISAEPLLAGLDIYWADFDWVVVGGESGPKRRDCGVEAIIGVAQQCQIAHVPCWCKQDCALRPGTQGRIPDDIWALKNFPS